MAIESVTASLGNVTKQLSETVPSTFEGELPVEEHLAGEQDLTVIARSDSGGIAVTKTKMMVTPYPSTGWIEPKTDWKPTDRFNWWDYNRIRSNLEWLYKKCCEIAGTPKHEDVGENIYDYSAYWEVKYFNAWEKNLEAINKMMYKENDIGATLTYFENGPFIMYDELNRIESASISIKELLKNQEAGIRHIPFTLGQFKAIR